MRVIPSSPFPRIIEVSLYNNYGNNISRKLFYRGGGGRENSGKDNESAAMSNHNGDSSVRRQIRSTKFRSFAIVRGRSRRRQSFSFGDHARDDGGDRLLFSDRVGRPRDRRGRSGTRIAGRRVRAGRPGDGRRPVAPGHGTASLRSAADAQIRPTVQPVPVRRPGDDPDQGERHHAERDAQRPGHDHQERGRHRIQHADRHGDGHVLHGTGTGTAVHQHDQKPVGRPAVPGQNRVPGIFEDRHDGILQDYVHREQRNHVRNP